MSTKEARTRASRKYNNKVYSSILVELPKDLVARFKEKCKAEGVSQASVIKEAIEEFLER